jgi:hypothetical protein
VLLAAGGKNKISGGILTVMAQDEKAGPQVKKISCKKYKQKLRGGDNTIYINSTRTQLSHAAHC